MIKDYKSKKWAEKHRIKKLAEMGLKMCPVFKTQCFRQDCMSKAEGRVFPTKAYKDGKNHDVFRVHVPTCESPLVTGYIEMEGNFPC